MSLVPEQASTAHHIVETFPEPASKSSSRQVSREPVPFLPPMREDTAASTTPRLVTVKALAVLYGLKLATVYGFIKADPAFPYRNVGLKKKYVVDVDQFETWLANRMTEEKNMQFGIPTATELIARFKR